MRQFSIVIVISTLLSLLVSFYNGSFLYSRFGKLERDWPIKHSSEDLFWFEETLDNDLFIGCRTYWDGRSDTDLSPSASSTHSFVGSISLIVGALWKGEFIAQGDRGEFVLVLEYPKKTSVDQGIIFSREKIEEFVSSKRGCIHYHDHWANQWRRFWIRYRNTHTNLKLLLNLFRKINAKKSSRIMEFFLKNEIMDKFPGVKHQPTPISRWVLPSSKSYSAYCYRGRLLIQ